MMKRSAFVRIFVMAMRDLVCDNEHNVWLRNEYGVGSVSAVAVALSASQGQRRMGRESGSRDFACDTMELVASERGHSYRE